ncbi:hypothetical protein AB1N83_006703 [Pleurotus pulmonarius]
MDGDIHRMLIFGITIEGGCMNLWYFSQSHSIKSPSFKYIGHPETLIHLLFADDKDLGIDPYIALYWRN